MMEGSYKTRLVPIESGDEPVVQEAGELIRAGHLVAFPTETVYGLGCDGLNEEAARKVFATKGRPADNPLILHIADLDMMDDLVEGADQLDREFLQTFWPGPMTLIFRRKSIIPDTITGGGETVAIRFPNHPLAQKFIKACDRPIAAPSANISGRPSPTTAQDVLQDMDGRIPLILDGGACQIGIESTVIDMTVTPPLILRPGYYTPEDLDAWLPGIALDQSILKAGVIPKSPGQKYKHYAPKADMVIGLGPVDRVTDWLLTRSKADQARGLKVGILCFEEEDQLAKKRGDHFSHADKLILQGSRSQPRTMAHDLFSNLRKFDRAGMDIILAVGLEEGGFETSVMNRMKKSAGGQVLSL